MQTVPTLRERVQFLNGATRKYETGVVATINIEAGTLSIEPDSGLPAYFMRIDNPYLMRHVVHESR